MSNKANVIFCRRGQTQRSKTSVDQSAHISTVVFYFFVFYYKNINSNKIKINKCF